MTKLALIPLIAAFAGLACSSSVDNTAAVSGSFSSVVTGLWVTSPAGPKLVTTWGNPSEPNESADPSGGVINPPPGTVHEPPPAGMFSNPYPNPTSGKVTFSFTNDRRGDVRILIARARLMGEQGPDAGSVGGGIVAAPAMEMVRELNRGAFEAGTHTTEWDGRDDAGRPVPAGFYKVYVMRQGKIDWHAILLYRSLNDIPSDLREIVAKW